MDEQQARAVQCVYGKCKHSIVKGAMNRVADSRYLLQTSGLILDVVRQQNDHAKFFPLVRQLQHLAIQILNVPNWKFFLLIHHLHGFCVFLDGYKKKKKNHPNYSLLSFKERNLGPWGGVLSGNSLVYWGSPVVYPWYSHTYKQEQPRRIVSPDLIQSEWSIGCVLLLEFILPHSLEVDGIHQHKFGHTVNHTRS